MKINWTGDSQQIKEERSNPNSLIFLIERYIKYLEIRGYTEQTVYGRVKLLRYFKKYCDQMEIEEPSHIDRKFILNYQSYLYHYRKKNQQPLTLGSQKERLMAVSQFFSYLTRESLIPFNPASDLELPRAGQQLPRVILSPEEVEAIMSIPNLNKPIGLRDRAVLEIFYSTGIRRTEMCELDINDVDFGRQILRIKEGKGRKDRFVPVGERALKWTDKYLIDARPKFLPKPGLNALFVSGLGERLASNRLSDKMHKIIEKAEIGKEGSCHLFRHAFATALLENGCDIRHIQAMLGHKKLETTQVYTHVSLRELQQAHGRFHPAKF